MCVSVYTVSESVVRSKCKCGSKVLARFSSLKLYYYSFEQGMIRLYDIPGHTFESDDDDVPDKQPDEGKSKGEPWLLK